MLLDLITERIERITFTFHEKKPVHFLMTI